MANRLRSKADVVLLVVVLGLACIGVVIIFSANHSSSQVAEQSLYKKQILWLIIGCAGLTVMSIIPHRIFYALSYIVYTLAVISLVGLVFLGQRWYFIGPVSVQPSELAKIAAIFAVARFLSTRKVNRFQDILVSLCLVAVPSVLVLLEPDLGTALVFVVIVIPMLYWSGLGVARIFFLLSPVVNIVFSIIYIINGNWIAWTCFMLVLFGLLYFVKPKISVICTVIAINLAVGLATPYLWNNVLKEYQRTRVKIWMYPEEDPLGAGYHVLESKVAIGSGGFSGKGYLQGTQTKLDFLPEQHTDFIFAVVGEEFGFVGSLFILLLFGFFLYRGIRIAANVRNSFASLVAMGIVSVFVFHIVVNIGMTLGIMPVVGLPLPFLSYGGSSLLTSMCMVGLLQNIWIRRHAY